MEKKTRILLAEDDENLGKILATFLEAKGYKTTLAVNGNIALECFKNNEYDICIFDIMMPIKDGFSLAKDVRNINSKIPIIFLTARSLKEDVIEGLKLGADDYITKPFNIDIVLLKIQAILRRTNENSSIDKIENIFKIGSYTFDYLHQVLKLDDKIQKLTTKESELLKVLCKNLNNSINRNDALIAIWGNDSFFSSRSMDVYLTKLRKYLKSDTNIELINIHGVGFKLIVNQ